MLQYSSLSTFEHIQLIEEFPTIELNEADRSHKTAAVRRSNKLALHNGVENQASLVVTVYERSHEATIR